MIRTAIALFFILSLCSFAAKPPLQFNVGLQAAIPFTFGNMTFAGSNAFDQERRIRQGFSGGIVVDSKIWRRKLRLESGLLFSINRHENVYTQPDRIMIISNHINDLGVPLLLKYRFRCWRWEANAGAMMQFPIYSKQESIVKENGSVYVTPNGTSSLRRAAIPSAVVGLRYGSGRHWSVNVQYRLTPNGYFKRPNYNNQYFGAIHTLSIGAVYYCFYR